MFCMSLIQLNNTNPQPTLLNKQLVGLVCVI